MKKVKKNEKYFFEGVAEYIPLPINGKDYRRTGGILCGIEAVFRYFIKVGAENCPNFRCRWGVCDFNPKILGVGEMVTEKREKPLGTGFVKFLRLVYHEIIEKLCSDLKEIKPLRVLFPVPVFELPENPGRTHGGAAYHYPGGIGGGGHCCRS